MEQQVITTNDGSKTIFLPHMQETYHSSHGALQEAIHVFIKHGLQAISQDEVAVFEMGFGTGLNALLAAIEATESQRKVQYCGIEAFPVSTEIAMEMDYCSKIGAQHQPLFETLHQSSWNEEHSINANFSFEKLHQKIEDHAPRVASFDIVFYDAFGPNAQEDMWHPQILEKMYQMIKPGGFLVTYCAKGQVKRDLKALGFEIEPLPGPPGKREMTRAWKR